MLVSHLFKRLAEPLIYKNIFFPFPREKLVILENTDRGLYETVRRVHRLIDTLVARPDLRSLNSRLSLDFQDPAWYKYFPLRRPLQLLPQLQELSLPPPPSYTTPLEDSPSLTSVQLDFDGWTSSDGSSPHMVARYMFLPNLRRVHATGVLFGPGSDPRQSLDKIKEQYGGSFVDDLRFLKSKVYGPNTTDFSVN